MTGLALQQRCWNHEGREAVCRCPECGRSFCRECVTEHEARLLCASCLGGLARARLTRRAGTKLVTATMLVGGIFLAWMVFYGTGEAFIVLTNRLEQTSWQNR